MTAAKIDAVLSPVSLFEGLLSIRGSQVPGELVACITLAVIAQASSE